MSFIGLDEPVLQGPRPVEPAKGIQPELESLIRNLERALRLDQERYVELDAYYNGAHPHSFDSVRFQQAFGKQLRSFADNWMRLTVQTTADRLMVQGFRVGNGDDTGAADNQAWRIWQANNLKSGAPLAHREAMKFGTCFVMVDPFDADGRRIDPNTPPAITIESPMQVVGQRDSQNRYRLLNALKKWIGDDGHLYLNLYLPDVVYKYRSASPPPSMMPGDQGRLTQETSWEQYGEAENPLGVVPIIPMENSPDLVMGGRSDLEDLIPLNDALNKVLRDMLVTSEYQAFQQRVIIGAELPKDPVTNQPMTEQQIQLMASKSRAWLFPNPQTKVESLPQVDLTPYTSAVDLFIHHLAILGRLPSYLLVGKLANLSADAIRASELGFVAKLKTKQIDFGTAWENAIALGLSSMGSDNGSDVIETIWASAEAQSGSILSNELTQMVNVGLPRSVALERYGASPQDLERWRAMKQIDDADFAPAQPLEHQTEVPAGSEVGTEARAEGGNQPADG